MRYLHHGTNAGSRRHRTILFGVILTALWAFAPMAAGVNFAWLAENQAAAPGITPAMFLRDDNVQAVDQFLAGQSVKALKINLSLSPRTIDAIYNKYKIDYTFVDYESADAAARTQALVNQLRASTMTGPALATAKAYVSNYSLTPAISDSTSPAPQSRLLAYLSAGLNMASPDLYPGSFTFRNPASGNSTAPNIRSALFTLPIQRLSFTTAGLSTGQANVPYVNRFNNWGNSALDSDGDSSNGYQFATANQLPSRGDFSAQVLHYRLRGAQGVHGLDGGVMGYSQQQFQSDISAGWSSLASVNQVFADRAARVATLDTRVKTDGVSRSSEDAGVIWSGAYSLGQGKMVLLMSNLDEAAHILSLPATIAGKAVGGDFDIAAGTHRILEFNAAGARWSLASNTPVFTDSDRGGVGVPEPAALGAVAGLALLLCGRRRRA